MEVYRLIKFLDMYGSELKAPEIIELSWNRKFNEAGNFSIYMPASSYKSEYKYVQIFDRPETGVIQKTVYEEKPQGDYVTLSGFFIEKLLDGGALLQTNIIDEGTKKGGQERVRKLLYDAFKQETNNLKQSLTRDYSSIPDPQSKLKPFLYETTLLDNGIFNNETSLIIEAGEPIGTTLYTAFKQDNLSYYAAPKFNPSKSITQPRLGLEIVPRRGRKLKDHVFFGKELGNVKNVTYAFDDSGAKPILQGVQILPEGVRYASAISMWRPDWKTDWAIVETFEDKNNMPKDMGESYPKKVVKTSIDEITENNEVTVRSKMKKALKLEMLNTYKEETISVDIIQNRFLYRRDYDLGDEVTIFINELQKQYSARIIEVREVYAKNTMQIELVLGTPRKQEYRKVVI